MSDYILETQYKISNSALSIRKDDQGFGCVQICDYDNIDPTVLVLPPELALVLAEAIKKCAEDLIKNG